MTRTDTLLTVFRNSKIHTEGEVKLGVKCQETSMTKLLSFYVTSASDIAILGCKACTALNIVTRVAIDSVSNTTVLTKDSLLKIYGDVFTGIGEYKKPYHIEVDSKVPPVIQHCRKVTHARYDNLKQTLSDLDEKGIVASIDKPTDWVDNLVITEKRDGRMRVCLDPKPLNRAIKCERYEIPTPSDVQSRLSGMNIFTVIDMNYGCWHVKLSEESSYLCTFHTPWGRKRFLRMPFGISSASEVMQKLNEEAFSDIQGVNVIAYILYASDNQWAVIKQLISSPKWPPCWYCNSLFHLFWSTSIVYLRSSTPTMEYMMLCSGVMYNIEKIKNKQLFMIRIFQCPYVWPIHNDYTVSRSDMMVIIFFKCHYF